MTYTEFDEQSETKQQALSLLRAKTQEFYAGLETMGVVDGYRRAALDKGATGKEVEEAIKMAWETHRETHREENQHAQVPHSQTTE